MNQNNTYFIIDRKKFQVSTQKVLHAHSFNFQMYMKQIPKNLFLAEKNLKMLNSIMQIHDAFTQRTVIPNSTFVCMIKSPSINPVFEEKGGDL